ncbi:MAG: NADH-quinone oxidoreductase subunit A [Candidatus Ranarchaeia archaeon]
MAVEEFIPFIVFIVTVVCIIGAMIIVGYLLGPRNPSRMKYDTFNAGQEPPKVSHKQFTFQYYPYLVMFLTFDVIGMFLILWAANFSLLSVQATHIIFVMLLILVIPLSMAGRVARRTSYWKR